MKYYPLRPIQRWMVDSHFEKAKSTMMNIGGLYKLSATIDMEHLAEAINFVLERHDIFRCRFVFHPETSDLCQHFEGELEKVFVEQLSDAKFKKRMEKLREPYYLIDKPLYRIYLMQTPRAKYIYADFYHAIIDGVSIAYLLWNEIDATYRGRKNPKALSYADYVASEAAVPAEELAEGHEYWKKMLSGFDSKKHLLPTKIQGDAKWIKGDFNYEFKNLMEEFFRTTRINENNYFLGASMLALAKLTGSGESVVSWTHNGRISMRERRLIGLMLVQYPCAWDFHENITIEEFLNRLEGQVRTGIKYRKSLGIIYDEGIEDNCVTFIFQKELYLDFILADTLAMPIYLPPNEISAAENSLDIEVYATEMGKYDLALHYDASRYVEKDMRRFAETLNKILIEMKNPNAKVSEILA